MAWKRFWNAMRGSLRNDAPPAGATAEAALAAMRREHLDDLRVELRAARERERRLLEQVAELATQIRMVLEDRFYRPVPSDARPTSDERPPLLDPESLVDVTQFDEAADFAQMQRELPQS